MNKFLLFKTNAYFIVLDIKKNIIMSYQILKLKKP